MNLLQMFIRSTKTAFLPILCYAFALFFRVHFQLIINYFKNKSKIL